MRSRSGEQDTAARAHAAAQIAVAASLSLLSSHTHLPSAPLLYRWTTIDGRDTLMRMDAMIEEMFDPNSYHSHIAPLESSTEAIKIASRAELGVKLRGDKQAQHLATSTLVSTALPKAPLVKTRRELAGSTYPNIHNQLAQIASVPVRQSLLQAARTRPSAEQSSVEAARLVEGMIARPARDPLAKLGSSRRSE